MKTQIDRYKEEVNLLILHHFTDTEELSKKLRPECGENITLIGSDEITNENDAEIIRKLLNAEPDTMYVAVKNQFTSKLPESRTIFLQDDLNPILNILTCDIYIYLQNKDIIDYGRLFKRLWWPAYPEQYCPKPAINHINENWDTFDHNEWVFCFGESVKKAKCYEDIFQIRFSDILTEEELNSFIYSQNTGIDKFLEVMHLLINNRQFRNKWFDDAVSSYKYYEQKAFDERKEDVKTQIHNNLTVFFGGSGNA